MKRLLVPLICLVLILSGCTMPAAKPISAVDNSSKQIDGLIYVGSFEGGDHYVTANNKFHVLNLYGTYREMGRQYGYLMHDELNRMYNMTINDAMGYGVTLGQLEQNGELFYDQSPSRLNEILVGMSETSGLTLEQHKTLNAGTVSVIMAKMISMANVTSGCSGVAFWGNYSKDGRMYFGRNWDMDIALLQPYLSGMTVAVYHPGDGSNSVANLEFAGEIYTETAMNDKGIFLELNNGGQADSASYSNKRVWAATELFAFMFDSSNMADIDREFETTLDSDSYIIQVANKDVAYSYEWPTFGVRKRSENVSGLLVAYNSFVEPYPPEWVGKINPPLANDKRRDNFLVLANSPEYKGKMDAELMKQFLSVGYFDGGGKLPSNVFQVVAVPEDRIWWLKGNNYSDFEFIPLGKLFDK
ncbi:MAG: C45 family autoproteolytic acyltransferase/hydrolase [Candidatus Micrarchaeia archaeon]